LRREDVDFLRREVHVRHQLVSVPGVAAHLGPPKTASSLRTVPSVVNRQSLHRSLAAALQKAALPAGITFHQLRHTYASLLIDGGESVTLVADRMGHKNASETGSGRCRVGRCVGPPAEAGGVGRRGVGSSRIGPTMNSRASVTTFSGSISAGWNE
jgi:hypothetical protein